MTKIICLRCGSEFYAKSSAKYCLDCRTEVKRERARRHYRETCSGALTAPPKPQPKAKERLSIAEVDRLAAAKGLSYGKYVAMYGKELK